MSESSRSRSSTRSSPRNKCGSARSRSSSASDNRDRFASRCFRRERSQGESWGHSAPDNRATSAHALRSPNGRPGRPRWRARCSTSARLTSHRPPTCCAGSAPARMSARIRRSLTPSARPASATETLSRSCSMLHNYTDIGMVMQYDPDALLTAPRAGTRRLTGELPQYPQARGTCVAVGRPDI